MNQPTASARDILGVPVLPPGNVSASITKVRARLRRAVDGMAPPPVQILETLFGALEHRVLVALCELEVPDHIRRPVPLGELAGAVGADPVRLERLVRFAAARGWLRLDRRGRVRATGVTRFLRNDHPGGWRAWVDFAGAPEITAAIAALSPTSDQDDVFAHRNGAPFFAWMADHPDRWAVFDQAMAAGARMHALALAAALDWTTTRRICDVGGGTGDLLVTLLDLLPEAEGTVLDLPGVVARAIEHPRLRSVAGDAFTSVPPGHDSYLLVNVVHDWSDADATRILEQVARAAAGARIVVVENDHPAAPYDRVATGADILMGALTNGGRERTAEELAAIAREAGVTLVASTRLASGDWAHELR